MNTDLLFCGREQELALIDTRWRLASDMANPQPQVVVIDAERGAGKTRLALEWYRRMAAPDAGQGYWPDPAQLLGRSLSLNPDPALCRFDQPIPFLWWGVGAQEDRGEAVAQHVPLIAPHLVAMSMRARMAASGRELAKIWRDVGLDAAANLLQLDSVVSVGKALFETARLVGGLRGEMDPRAAQEAEFARSRSRVDALLGDLETVLNPGSRLGYARIPAVILIDDAQFAIGDPSLTRFTEKLLSEAVRQRWPLMVLITYWRRELTTDLTQTERSMAGILHHARHGGRDEPGPSAGAPGGYLNDGNYLRIALPQVPDLKPALATAFPGIAPAQAADLIETIGGNPRFLEQIIAYLRANPRLFDDFDQARPLGEAGLAEVLNKSVAIHDVVMARLLDERVPPEVREALSLASVQGMRVVTEIVDAAGEALLGHSLSEALRAGENPYAMLAFEEGGAVGAFTDRLVLQVAGELRRNIKGIHDEAAVQAALRRILAERFAPDAMARLDRATLEASAGVALRLCQDVADPEQRRLILAASCLQQQIATEPETEREALDRFMAAFAPGGEVDAEAAARLAADLPMEGLLAQAGVALFFDRDADAKAIASACLAAAKASGRPELLAEGLEVKSTVLAATGGEMKAVHGFDQALELRRTLFAEQPGEPTLHKLASVLSRSGRAYLNYEMPGLAVRRAQEAVQLYRDLRGTEIIDAIEVERGLGAALNALFDVGLRAGEKAVAFEALTECLTVTRALAAEGDDGDKRNLSAVLNTVADLMIHPEGIDSALVHVSRSVEIATELATRLPGIKPQHDLGTALTIRARVHAARGDHDARIADLEHAAAIMSGLSERLRTSAAAQDLVAARRNLAKALEDSGRAEAASEVAGEAAADESMSAISRARAEFGRASLAFGKGREEEGDAALARGLELARESIEAQRHGGTVEDRMTIGYILVTMAQRSSAKGEHGDALACAEQVIVALTPLAENHESRQRIDAMNEALHIAVTLTPAIADADRARRIFRWAMQHVIHLIEAGNPDQAGDLILKAGQAAEACEFDDVADGFRELMQMLLKGVQGPGDA